MTATQTAKQITKRQEAPVNKFIASRSLASRKRQALRFGFLVLVTLSGKGMANTSEGEHLSHYQANLNTSSPALIQRLVLPQDIQEKLSFANGQDIQVNNEFGEQVPFILRQVIEQTINKHDIKLNFYPVKDTDKMASKPASTATNINITINTTGNEVHAPAAVTPEVKEKTVIKHYIVETDTLSDKTVETLTFEWGSGFEGISQLMVETSDQLQHWQRIGNIEIVSQLENNGNRLRKGSIDIASTVKKYLKLSWTKGPHPKLTSIVAQTSETTRTPQYKWSNELQLLSSNEGQALTFYRPPAFGSTNIRLKTNADRINTFYLGKLYSRRTEADDWGLLSDIQFFSFDSTETASVKNSLEASLKNNGHPYWKIEFLQPQINESNKPAFQLERKALELLFLNIDKKQHSLRFGSNKRFESRLSDTINDILEKEKAQPAEASTGEIIAVSKVTPEKPVDWKKWALWLILGLGTVVLFGMAKSLSQQLKK